MNSLPAIRTAKSEAQSLFATALQVVCGIAERHDPQCAPLIAEMNGYRRELEVLNKLELDLIAHGKPTEETTA